MELFTLFLSAAIFNNILLHSFLGMCPFLGVSKKTSSAIGMGGAVTFVIVGSSIITYFLYHNVLDPLNIEYMRIISFILVIASFVQFTEMVIKRFSPRLYKSLGIYLPLITTNCAVLYVAQINISRSYSFLESMVYSVAVPVGFTVVLYIMATIRERLDIAKTPDSFKGNPVALVTAALMALALGGFVGIM